MKGCARFFALVFAILFILILPLSMLVFNLGRVVFNRPLLKTILTEAVTESQLIPSTLAWFSEEVSQEVALRTETEDDLTTIFMSLTLEGWQAIRVELVSDDILAGWVSSTVDGFFDWIASDDPAPSFVLDMQPFKNRVNSEHGLNALEVAYNALPVCTSEQISEFKALLERSVPGSNAYYPPCQFSEIYQNDQLADYLNSLHEVVNILPDTFAFPSSDASTTPDEPNDGLKAVKTSLRLVQSAYWLGLVISVFLFSVIWLLVIRSAKDLARWGGIPLALAGILALVLSWLPGISLAGILISGPLQETPASLRDEILQVAARLTQEVFYPMMIQAVILFMVGGLLLVFIGGRMGKQKPNRKPREEAY